MSRKAVEVRACSYGASMRRNVSVDMGWVPRGWDLDSPGRKYGDHRARAWLVPERLGAAGERADQRIEWRRGDVRRELLDAALTQGEFVGQQLHAGFREFLETRRLGAGARAEHGVLDQEYRDAGAFSEQRQRQLAALAETLCLERIARFDEQIFRHGQPLQVFRGCIPRHD